MGPRIDEDEAPLGDISSTPPTGTPTSSRVSALPSASEELPTSEVAPLLEMPPPPPVPSWLGIADAEQASEPEERTSPGVAPPPGQLYGDSVPPSDDFADRPSERPSQRPSRRPQVVVASGSIAPKAGVERHADTNVGADAAAHASVEAEPRLAAVAMNVIEASAAPVAGGTEERLSAPAIDAEGPVQGLAAAVLEDAAQAEAARAEAEVARLLRESRERNRKILVGAALVLALLLGILVWTKEPLAPAASGAPRATEGAPDATASGEPEAHMRGSSPAATESSPDGQEDAAAEQSKGSDLDAAAAEAAPEVSAAADDIRAAPKARPRSPARKSDPDAPWIRR